MSTMTNPIPYSSMFHTPENTEALMEWCERHTGGEKIAAFTAMMMAFNLAHDAVERMLGNPGE